MLNDVLRAWSALVDYASGKAAVGAALDAVMINEGTLSSLHAIGKIINGLGLKVEGGKNGVQFFTTGIKRSVAFKVLALWEANVPVESTRGFFDRFYVDELVERAHRFRETWEEQDFGRVGP